MVNTLFLVWLFYKVSYSSKKKKKMRLQMKILDVTICQDSKKELLDVREKLICSAAIILMTREIGFFQFLKFICPGIHSARLQVEQASECKSACFNNCSCSGYAYDQELRCLVWDGPLLNLKHFSSDNLYQTEFYLKLAPPDFTKGWLLVTNCQFVYQFVMRRAIKQRLYYLFLWFPLADTNSTNEIVTNPGLQKNLKVTRNKQL
jgi:hypothetical protein